MTLQPLQSRAVQTTDLDDRAETVHEAFTFAGPLFKSDEAAEYLGYRGPHALRSLYRFIAKRGITPGRRFRTLLIKKTDLDRAIGLHRGGRK